MGAGANVVAHFYEKMGIEIVEGPAKAAEMEAAVKELPFGSFTVSAHSGTITISEEEIVSPFGILLRRDPTSKRPPLR